MRDIPLSSPEINDSDIEAVVNVLKTPRLSLGPKLVEFEDRIADYVGVKYAVAVNSGTSALHLIVRSLGIADGDEVITTPFSFVASSNCILFERAKPVFVDIAPVSYNIDTSKIEEKITAKTKAILAVDVFGYPADWDMLEHIAQKHNLLLIDDSCEALGAQYKGRNAGTFGEAGAFAFYPNKQMTTGEGGVIVTNDENIAMLCRSMRNQGRGEGDTWLQHSRLGYNFRIADINCALGISQLDRIDVLLKKRDKVAQMYNEKLGDIPGLLTPCSSPEIKRSWFVYVITLPEKYDIKHRDRVMELLKGNGIGCSNYFTPIHLQPFYKHMFGYKEGDFPVTEQTSSRTIALPFFSNLKENDIDYVVQNIKRILKTL